MGSGTASQRSITTEEHSNKSVLDRAVRPIVEAIEGRILFNAFVSVTAVDDGSEWGPDTGSFLISGSCGASSPNDPDTISVTYHIDQTVSGTATNGADYTGFSTSGTVVLTKTATSNPLFFNWVGNPVVYTPILDEDYTEGSETIRMTIDKADISYTGSGTKDVFGTHSSTNVIYADNIIHDYVPTPPPLTPPTSSCPVTGPGSASDGQGGGTGPSGSGMGRADTGVNYFDGTVNVAGSDLDSVGLGASWGLTRQWSNRNIGRPNLSGAGWSISDLPRLRSYSGGNVLGVDYGGSNQRWFAKSGSDYNAKFYLTDKLSYAAGSGGSPGEFTVVDAAGNTTTYNDFTATLPAQRGQMKKFTDAGGNTAEVTLNSDGRVQTVTHKVAGTTAVDTYDYAYNADGQITQVEWKQGGTLVRRVTNTYSGSGQSALLTKVDVSNGTSVIDSSYYRYDSNGRLAYSFGHDSFTRLSGDVSSYASASDATVAPYADVALTYDGSGRVSQIIVQGTGCSSCTAGLGTYTYSYSTNSSTDPHPSDPDFNRWAYKTTETLPDLSTNVVYCNEVGQVMVKQFTDHGTSQVFRDYYQYDAAGRCVLHANPSAVTGLWESADDLLTNPADTPDAELEGLDPSKGLIETTVYGTTIYGVTGAANTTTAGDVLGYVKNNSIQHGEGGSPILQSSMAYIERDDAAGHKTFVPDSETVYASDASGGSSPRTTNFVYTWQGSTAQIAQETVVHPSVGSGENGPGASTTDSTVFDAYGRPVWTRDADGFITYTEYDQTTGATKKRIADVDTTTLSNSLIAKTLTSGALTASGTTATVALNGHGYRVGDWVQVSGATPSAYNGLFQVVSVPNANTFTYTAATAPGSTATGTVVVKWGTPPGGGKHLVKDYGTPDAVGRTLSITEANGTVTYMRYDDVNRTVRTYPGWHSVGGGNYDTTGPVTLTATNQTTGSAMTDRTTLLSASRNETLTFDMAPVATATPSGSEPVDETNILSLSIQHMNTAGQVIATDEYATAPVNYPIVSNGDEGTAGTHFYRTLMGYDDKGALKRVVTPNGTITRTVHDGQRRTLSEWIGTNDTGANNSDPTGGGASGNNMIKVADYQYDGGIVGDSNLTKITQYPGGGADNRVTEYYHDWRGRTVATKGGVQVSEGTAVQRPITFSVFDNLGEQASMTGYDGDNVTITRISEESGSDTDGNPDAPSSSLRRSYSTANYDQLGRVYRSDVYSVNSSTGALSSNTLHSDTFYDRRGNTLKTASPGGVVAKYLYDGLGRTTKAFATDGGGDTGWTDAGNVSGDAVLEQSETTYDVVGNPIFSVTRQRNHDETTTGTLGDASTTPKARVSYSATYYDALNRPTSSIDFGTNGGTLDGTGSVADLDTNNDLIADRPSSPSTGSDKVLRTDYAYNAQGLLETTTDPRGIVGKTSYDLLGRTTKTIAAYVDGTPSDADDQTTLYGYDGSNHVTMLTADMPGSTDQQTQYVYGITTSGGSTINSNDVLKEVRYPDKTAGTPGTTSASKQQYTYNALGNALTFTDQNGSVHTYGYDVLGRPTADAVTTLGSGVIGSVRRLETAYDTQGNAYLFTSYNAASSGSIVNQVKNEFNGLGQLTAQYQGHNAAVTGSTSALRYAYTEMTAGANNSRLKEMTYPNGRELRYEYASGLDDRISQLSYLADDAGGTIGTHLEEYSYLGLGTVVSQKHPEPNVDLSYVKRSGESATDGGDQYTGFDRFGRVIDQRWLYASSGTSADRFYYGYDRDSNVLYKSNAVTTTDSELYHANGASNGYDLLNRLTSFARGSLSDANSDGTPDTVSTASRSQSWTLDALGNWNSATTGSATDTRTHNAQNQIASRTATPVTGAPTYDNNGNETNEGTQTGGGNQNFSYDAWNRLMSTSAYASSSGTSGGTTSSTSNTMCSFYEYDALGRRIETTDFRYYTSASCSAFSSGGSPFTYNWGCSTSSNEHTDLDYTDEWQVAEERPSTSSCTYSYTQLGPVGGPYTNTSSSSSSTYSKTDQYIWGQGYVDDMVLRDRTVSGAVTADTSFDSDGLQTTDFSSRTDTARGVAVQSNGKVVVAGTSVGGGTSDFAIARYNSNGSLDLSFGTSGLVRTNLGTSEGWSTADLESDGDILVGGYTTNGGGGKNFAVARYNSDGTLDSGFGSSGVVVTDFAGGDDVVRGLVVQPDGKVLVAGDSVNGSGRRVIALARFNTNGSLDDGSGSDTTPADTFGTSGKVTLTAGTGDAYGYGVALQPDGRIVVAGYDSSASNGTDMIAARFNTNGSLDDGGGSDSTAGDSFGTSGIATVDYSSGNDHAYALAVALDGSIILAGDAVSSGSAYMAVSRLTSGGTLDTTFNTTGKITALTAGSVANAVAVDGVGRITAAGSALRSGGTDHDFAIARFNADGTADTGFGASGSLLTNFATNRDDYAFAIALTPNAGAVIAGGAGGDFGVARYVPGGTAAQRLYALQDANHNVTALMTTSGGVVQRFKYDSYGLTDPSIFDGYDWAYRFQAGRLETATGLYNFRNRDYSATLGRWLRNDPAGHVDGLNLYEMLIANPASSIDPYGLSSGDGEIMVGGSNDRVAYQEIDGALQGRGVPTNYWSSSRLYHYDVDSWEMGNLDAEFRVKYHRDGQGHKKIDLANLDLSGTRNEQPFYSWNSRIERSGTIGSPYDNPDDKDCGQSIKAEAIFTVVIAKDINLSINAGLQTGGNQALGGMIYGTTTITQVKKEKFRTTIIMDFKISTNGEVEATEKFGAESWQIDHGISQGYDALLSRTSFSDVRVGFSPFKKRSNVS